MRRTWPQAKTNPLVLAVMCSSFVSKQPPAQSWEEMNEESCWRVLMGWVGGWRDGWMSVAVVVQISALETLTAFRAVLNFPAMI